MIGLGIDIGSRNFGITVVQFQDNLASVMEAKTVEVTNPKEICMLKI